MMKKVILTLILLNPFGMLTCMEKDDIGKEQSLVTIICSDGELKVTHENFEKLIIDFLDLVLILLFVVLEIDLPLYDFQLLFEI